MGLWFLKYINIMNCWADETEISLPAPINILINLQLVSSDAASTEKK